MTTEVQTIETETIEATVDDDVPLASSTALDLVPWFDDVPGYSVAEALPELDAGTLRAVSCVAAAALLSGQSFAIFLFAATCAWTLVSATFQATRAALFAAFFSPPPSIPNRPSSRRCEARTWRTPRR